MVCAPGGTSSVTVVPGATLVPAGGFWSKTTACAEPAGAWLLGTTLGVRPCADKYASASATFIPIRFFSATVDAPLDSTMLIALPLLALDPNPGLVEITNPFATFDEGLDVTAPIVNPFCFRAASAAFSFWPVTSGTPIPLLLPVRNTTAKIATASTTIVVMTATHGQTLRWGWSGPGPPSSGP